MHNQAIRYRPEIDGLRAVAVVPVILFHAGLSLFSGGFVGVDVFFVISGYLITSILLSELESGNFSILRFYERRARRILPALCCVTLFCALFAWFAMMPGELERFGKSVAAVATFMSNIYFWRTTDYFAPAAEDQLLLHTWSLAIEEQYYLLFPALLMLGWRFGRNRLFWMAAVAAAASLALAEWGSRHAPLADYYLLPTRAWELLGGSLLALMPAACVAAIQKRPGAARAGAWLGLALIAFAMLAFDRATPFPGLYALLPVVGTVLVIACASERNAVGRLLSNKLFIDIGLRSYSAYLWHQPLLAIARKVYLANPQLRLPAACIAILLTALLSALTYRKIETPLRKHRTSRVIGISAACLAGLFACALLLPASPLDYRPLGMLVQGNETALDYLAWADENLHKTSCPDKRDYGDYYTCRLGDPDAGDAGLVLWGDSLAGALVHGLDRKMTSAGMHGVAYISDGCPPIPGLKRPVAPNCRGDTHREILGRIMDEPQARTVLLLGNVTGGSRNKEVTIDGSAASWPAAAARIVQAGRQIEASGKRFYFIEQGPRFATDAAAFYFQQEVWGGAAQLSLPRADHAREVAPLRELGAAGTGYLRTEEFFCPDASCPAARDGKLLVYDQEHYTFDGSLLFADFILGRLKQADGL